MISIPTEAKVRVSIEQGSVYNFSPTTGVDNHYYVVLNKIPKSGDQIYLAYFTTKKQKVIDFIKSRNFDKSTCVEINSGECPFLYKWEETCINCNRVTILDIDELICLIDNSNGSCNFNKIPNELMGRIINGITASKMIAESIKNSLKL